MIPITPTTTFLDALQEDVYAYCLEQGSDSIDRVLEVWIKTENFRNSLLSNYEKAKPILIDCYIWIKIKTQPLQLKIITYSQLDYVKNLAIATACAAAGAFIFCICSPFTGGLYGALFYVITKGLFRLITYLEIDKKLDSYMCYCIVFSVGYLITSSIMIHLFQSPLTYLLAIPLAIFSCVPYILPHFLEE